MSLVKKDCSAKGMSRSSHRLPPEAIAEILSLSARGASSAEVRDFLKEVFSLTVHPNLISYYRRTRRDEIAALVQKELRKARRRSKLPTLAERLGLLDDMINKELAKPDGGSSMTIARAVKLASTMVYRAELLSLKIKEAAMLERQDESHELVLREIERRSHVRHI